jgi:hypothetical protein
VKQKDIILIIVVVFISGVVSVILSHSLFSSTLGQQQTEVVEAINPNFPTPGTTYFNSKSIDPTQLIQIGNNNNSNPFNGSQQ